jgi:uncharacterized membrane protein
MTQEPRDVPPARDVPPPPTPSPPMSPPPATADARTSTGLDPKLAGVLAYLLWIVGGILFLATEKQNQIVRFHAAQSVVLAIAEFVVWIALTILTGIVWFLGLVLWPVFALVALLVWLFLMYKAYMLERYKLPLLGDYAEKLAGRV